MTYDQLLHSVAGDSLGEAGESPALPLKISEEEEIERLVAEYLSRGGRITEVKPGATGAPPASDKFNPSFYMGPKLTAQVQAEREARAVAERKGEQA